MPACLHGHQQPTWSRLLRAPSLALRARGFWSWSLRFSLLLRAASSKLLPLLPSLAAEAAVGVRCSALVAAAPAQQVRI